MDTASSDSSQFSNQFGSTQIHFGQGQAAVSPPVDQVSGQPQAGNSDHVLYAIEAVERKVDILIGEVERLRNQIKG